MEINVCYAADGGFLPITIVSIVSLFETNQSIDVLNVYVLACDKYANEDIKKLERIAVKYNRMIHVISMYEKLELLKNTVVIKQFHVAAYLRIFIGSVLPQNVKKCLYLDGDTLVMGELFPIYKVNFKNAVAAVRDIWPVSYNLILGIDEKDLYFNSGVMLIDMEKWRKQDVEEKLLNHINKLQLPYRLNDQDVINICLRGAIDTLPIAYNMLYITRMYPAENSLYYSEKKEDNFYSIHEIRSAQKAPIIIHFAGGFMGKPWNKYSADKDAKFWLEFAEKSDWNSRNFVEKSIKRKVKKIIINLLPKKILLYLDYKITKKNINRMLRK